MNKSIRKICMTWALLIAGVALSAAACAGTQTNKDNNDSLKKDMAENTQQIPAGPVVKITTTKGDIIVKLYDDTPGHRDNFLKLVDEKFYDGVLFHRVIKDFMVQTGDPDSKNATAGQHLGAGDPGYTLPAEIDYPKHYHKYGALAAARTGDQVNPERRSSGSQFYIVTGKKYSEGQMAGLAQNAVMAKRQELFRKLSSEYTDSIRSMQARGDNEGLEKLRDVLVEQVEKEVPAEALPANIATDYTTIGGTPHLDGQYTVFGEVLEGMDVVEKIQNTEAGPGDRPKEDIRIISVELVK